MAVAAPRTPTPALTHTAATDEFTPAPVGADAPAPAPVDAGAEALPPGSGHH